MSTPMEIDSQPRAATKDSTSDLDVLLHPLVLLTISDHSTRARLTENSARVLGGLIGCQRGRQLEIMDCFEMVVQGEGINTEFLRRKAESMKKVFPDLDVVGWYSTGSVIQPQDLHIHSTVTEIFDSGVYLLVNTEISNVPTTQNALPITLYEGNVRQVGGAHQVVFTEMNYRIHSPPAEHIAVDAITHTQSSNSSQSIAATHLPQHLQNVHSSITMLSHRISILTKLAESINSGTVKPHPHLLRQINALCNSLPAVNSETFRQQFHNEFDDQMVVLLLAYMTSANASTRDLTHTLQSASMGAVGARGGRIPRGAIF
eukprot:c2439_g1_i2.p1 GENE.c2439_g1_i2~~c2439_g1_i2.p1  ORF type:complete len:328 (-),score=78.47 c2439_g1_i2:109-1059(-)